MIEQQRYTGSQGELVKLNTYLCRVCRRIYISPLVASKMGIGSGWFERTELERIIRADKTYDPVIRVRNDKKNLKTCPNCQ